MIKKLFLLACGLVFTGITLGQNDLWRLEISLNDRLQLPFFIKETFGETKLEPNTFEVLNGTEKIGLTLKTAHGDSMELAFKEMDSYLKFVYSDSKNIRGYWRDNRKGITYPITGSKGNYKRFGPTTDTEPKNVFNSYKVLFGDAKNAWPAVGLFEQTGDQLTGTFLTETGDYRFLEGNVFGNRLYLSCFDGAHAFVFTAKIFGDTLRGSFYSGASYKTSWEGVKNETAKIGSPDSLTYLISDSYNLSELRFRSLKGFKRKLDFSKTPLTIIQIMGSWCPNCLDETNYFKEIHKQYKEDGLNIIALGFESQKTTKKRRKHLKVFAKKAKIPYPVYLAGSASKKEASQMFSMLNEISSFPTTLFVNQKGKIIYVHTGFYGPGTGAYFERYQIGIRQKIEKCIK